VSAAATRRVVRSWGVFLVKKRHKTALRSIIRPEAARKGYPAGVAAIRLFLDAGAKVE